MDIERDKEGGEWRKIPEGLILESGQGVCRMHVPYVPPAEYDYLLEFSLVRDRIGAVYKGCVKDGQQVAWAIQHIHGEDVASVLWIDKVHGSSHPGTKVPQTMLKNNVRYRSLVEVRRNEVRAYLDGQLLARWSGSFRAGPSINPEKPLSFGAWDTGIIFHKAEIIPYTGSEDNNTLTPKGGETADNPLRRELVESVLSKGGTVAIRKDNTIVNVARMEDLPDGTFHLHHVDQVKGDFDDTDAGLLAHFPELSSMRLHRCSVTRLPLEELPELQNIELWSNRIPSETLKYLPSLSKLNRLMLYEGRLDRTIVDIVAQCQGLETLHLGKVGLKGGDLEQLTKLARLKNIIIESNLSDQGLEPLARMPSLERVELQDVNPVTVTLAPLRDIQVKEFGFFISKVTPTMLESLAMMPRLRTITIGAGEITGGSLQPLFGMKQLETIQLGLQINEAAIDELRKALPDVKITR